MVIFLDYIYMHVARGFRTQLHLIITVVDQHITHEWHHKIESDPYFTPDVTGN